MGFMYVGQKAYNCGLMLTEEILKIGYDKMEENMRPDNMDKRESIKEFYDKLPNPIKPLAFLLYSTKEDYTDFPKQVGALHIILQSIYPTYYYNTPKDQRIRLEFSKAIEAEYELDWQEFFNNSIDFDTLTDPPKDEEKYPIFVIQAQGGVPVNMSGPMPYYGAPVMAPAPAPVEYKGDENGDIEIDDDDLMDIFDIKVDSSKDYPSSSSSSDNASSTPAPKPVEEVQEEDTDEEDSMDDIYALLYKEGENT